MSRVGKKPVAIPAGVTAKVEGQKIAVKGAKGELSFAVPDDVIVTLDGNAVKVDPRTGLVTARSEGQALVDVRFGGRDQKVCVVVSKDAEKPDSASCAGTAK